jgi:hypothetical protein
MIALKAPASRRPSRGGPRAADAGLVPATSFIPVLFAAGMIYVIHHL